MRVLRGVGGRAQERFETNEEGDREHQALPRMATPVISTGQNSPIVRLTVPL